MPIYEFKCLKCNDCVEMLVMGPDEEIDIRCKSCNSRDMERIISSTRYSMGSGSEGGAGISAQSRACSGGSCTTYEIPGHSR